MLRLNPEPSERHWARTILSAWLNYQNCKALVVCALYSAFIENRDGETHFMIHEKPARRPFLHRLFRAGLGSNLIIVWVEEKGRYGLGQVEAETKL